MTDEETFNLAAARYDAGDPAGAKEILLQIVGRGPAHAGACNLLGMIHHEAGDPAAAVEWFNRAVAVPPGRVDYFHNLAAACCELNRRDEGLAAFLRAAQLAAREPEHLSMVARSLHDSRFYAQSLECARQILSMWPNDPDTTLLAGSALLEMGDHSQATELFKSVLARQPQSAGARWNLALALLLAGNFPEGWKEFESRHLFDDGPAGKRIPTPQWDGRPMPGGTLFVRSEGGFGDVLHYVRYLPMAARRAGKVIFECQPELIPLFQSYSGIARIVERGEPFPAFDEHAYLTSLPRIFGTDLTNVPAEVPYLRVHEDRLGAWRERVPSDGLKNVGLVWSGHGVANRLEKRSQSLEVFAPFAAARGVRFFSLQLGKAAAQARPAGLDLVDLTADIKDFADTAALVSRMDLVISVDTSVAHLAGALARPVWMLAPFVPDYRWMLGRTDSPWYPTMRLFRQTRLGDWATPVEQIVSALKELK